MYAHCNITLYEAHGPAMSSPRQRLARPLLPAPGAQQQKRFGQTKSRATGSTLVFQDEREQMRCGQTKSRATGSALAFQGEREQGHC